MITTFTTLATTIDGLDWDHSLTPRLYHFVILAEQTAEHLVLEDPSSDFEATALGNLRCSLCYSRDRDVVAWFAAQGLPISQRASV